MAIEYSISSPSTFFNEKENNQPPKKRGFRPALHRLPSRSFSSDSSSRRNHRLKTRCYRLFQPIYRFEPRFLPPSRRCIINADWNGPLATVHRVRVIWIQGGLVGSTISFPVTTFFIVRQKKQQKKNPRWVNDFSYFNEKFCLLATERGWSMKVPCLNMTARLIGLYWVWLTFRLTEMGLLERLMKTWRSCTVEWGSSISFEAAKTAKKTYKKLCRRWQDGTISRKHQSCRSDHKKIYTMHPFL